MKKLALCVALLFASMSLGLCNIQSFLGKMSQFLIGGEDGKNYAAIIMTSNGSSRTEAIKSTIDFLMEYDLVPDKEKVLNELKEYDETQMEFTVPVSLRIGFHTTPPVMGASGVLLPMILNMDLSFQFYDNGAVRLVFKNFKDYSYVARGYYDKAANPNALALMDDSSKEYDEAFTGYYTTASMTGSGMAKAITGFLAWANKGLEGVPEMFNAINEVMGEIKKQFEVMDRLTEAGYFCIMDGEEEIGMFKEIVENHNSLQPEKSMTATIDMAQSKYDQGYMLNVMEKLWREDIKQQFDFIIQVFRTSLNGQITGIAEDGEQTWELVGEKLLPVDKKLRSKLEKAGKTYYTYYE